MNRAMVCSSALIIFHLVVGNKASTVRQNPWDMVMFFRKKNMECICFTTTTAAAIYICLECMHGVFLQVSMMSTRSIIVHDPYYTYVGPVSRYLICMFVLICATYVRTQQLVRVAYMSWLRDGSDY
jgi:hypothetical protein